MVIPSGLQYWYKGGKMAQFSIRRGDSSRISTSSTPFRDGTAYFTPENGHLYIDSYVNGSPKRVPVTSSYNVEYGTLYASGWRNLSQRVPVVNLRADHNGIIGVSQSISDEALADCNNADLYVKSQENGYITIAVKGSTPTHDIPFVVVQFD